MKIKIVPFEKATYVDDEVIVDKVSVTYAQCSDNSGEDGNEEVQEITLSARNSGVNRYINIKTDSWSVNNIEELQAIIEDFKNRALLNE